MAKIEQDGKRNMEVYCCKVLPLNVNQYHLKTDCDKLKMCIKISRSITKKNNKYRGMSKMTIVEIKMQSLKKYSSN